MDVDEREIIDYLKSWPGQFVAGREISRRAGGKWRYRENPDWALPVLRCMAEKGLLESDAAGHYRLRTRAPEKRKAKQWMSPELGQALEQSSKEFEEALAPEDQDDFYTNH